MKVFRIYAGVLLCGLFLRFSTMPLPGQNGTQTCVTEPQGDAIPKYRVCYDSSRWKSTETGGRLELAPKDGAKHIGLRIISRRLSAPEYGHYLPMVMLAEALKKPKFRLLGTENISENGLSWQCFDFRYKEEGKTLRMWVACLSFPDEHNQSPINKGWVSLLFKAPPGKYDRYFPVVREVIEQFRFE